MAKLREALTAKVRKAKNLEGEVAEQYMEEFDEVINQVKFFYADYIYSWGYFKEIWERQLVNKPLLGANASKAEAKDQTKTLEDVADRMRQMIL